MLTRRSSSRRLLLLLAVPVAALLLVPGASVYYEYSGGKSCARCHEIWQPYTDWHTSTHRNIQCSACHGNVFTVEAGFHLRNLRRLVAHLRGRVPERVRLRAQETFRVSECCQTCHQQEWAEWAASLHGATYAEIFLDPKHNRQQLLADDCLRCHGMHFEGGIRDLIVPVATKGPWKLKQAALAQRPTIPCLTCHQMHRHGQPLERPAVKPLKPGASQEIHRPSLALFDRRELEYVAAGDLPLPAVREGERQVKISPDSRQALCYQCHAPLATLQVGSGDDRSPIGVHEGLGCLACHEKHGEKTRASCANCHPQLSNCGLNVETMDTTYKSTASPHNIHFVKCRDCHTKGVPKKRRANRPPRLTAAAQ